MRKQKTLEKHDDSLIETPFGLVKPRKVKGKVTALETSKKLKDKKFMQQALTEALFDGDKDAFTIILASIIRNHGVRFIAKKSGITERSIQNAISDKGNPGIKTITAILKAVA